MNNKATAFAAVVAICMAAAPAGAQDMKALTIEGKGVIKSFAKALKGELVGAISTGGPVKAISVCSVKAPEIRQTVSKASGWSIARSSHKLRNPNNAADAFDMAAIRDFLARQSKGEKSATMVKTAIVDEGGKKVFRMVKAIPTGGVCVICHGGKNVGKPVVDALAKLYPDDKARGFKAGEMRGIFTLRKVLN